ncbi:MAG: biopolymer transporter ExbD [Deltaproteobacteria bacterium]|nr:biopolymer transporter ExbD [Deltaproteobacteria bacterium]
MAWKTARDSNERVLSEINITPLTDVMLVLLVIFMVTTPLIMVESFKIKLPRAVTADTEPGKGAVVAVSENGLISLNGKTVTMDGLYEGLKTEFSKGGDKNVVIKADGATKHSIVVNVLDTAKLAGAAKLSIATERGERNKGR